MKPHSFRWSNIFFQTLPDPGLNDFFQSNKKIWAMAGFSFTLFIQNAVELGQNWNAFDGCGAKVKNVRRAQDSWDYNVSQNHTVPTGQDNEIACKWYLASLVLLGLSMFLQCTHAIMCFCNSNPQLDTNTPKLTGY